MIRRNAFLRFDKPILSVFANSNKQLFEFANQLDVPINKNYAEYVELGREEHSSMHVCIKEKDINKLWDNLDKEDVDLALILIYTGLRPNELLNMKKENA